MFELIDSRWDQKIDDAVRAAPASIRIISPFIKEKAARRFLAHGVPGSIRVITRFNLDDFADGVSDIAALRMLMQNGATVRGIRHLHAKLYLFGDTQAIVTSANLTEAALTRNHEFGFVANEPAIIARCGAYFDGLWAAGADLTRAQLDRWQRVVTQYQTRGARPGASASLGDEGADAGLTPAPVLMEPRFAEAGQAFVKFFGEGHNRAAHSSQVLHEVESSGCHFACSYPRDRRPRLERDGAAMFMAHLAKQPKDVLIFGRAIGMEHKEGRDDATAVDLERRGWKEKWPHYIRVHHAEFVAGTLSNGVSLNELMGALGSDSFVSTQRNAAGGSGNTNPRTALAHRASIQLTPRAHAWLNERLERAFSEHGRLPADELARLDWPDVVVDPETAPLLNVRAPR